MITPPAPVDPATIPTLSGVLAPISEERDFTDLPVEGEIPADLRGAYIRNGPNPQFPPLGSYTYPLEGDAMLHGIWVEEDGSVQYRNRWVWTPHMRLEKEAGKALWAGLMTPYFPGPDVVPEQYANDFKPYPFINIVHHGGRWLALAEVDAPWEVTAGLEVVGTEPYTFGGKIPGMCAHPRIDLATSEMVLFRYNPLEAPYLAWGTVAADGSVTRPLTPIDIDAAYMIHDFVLTERYVVLFVPPARFDLDAMITGSGEPLAWKDDQPMRIAVVPRDGSAVRWFETDPFWVYHFANGYEDGDAIVTDLSWWRLFSLGPNPNQAGATARVRIDLASGKVTVDHYDDQMSEFGRIDDRIQARPHRYFSVSGKTSDMDRGHWNLLKRFDTQTGAVSEWSSGRKVFAEVVFAPAVGGDPEQGYYVTFRTDLDTLESDWVVLDASDLAAGPVARVPLPGRVPEGLHGNWFSLDVAPPPAAPRG